MEASQLNLITGDVIGAALRIHSALGPGLLESVYEVVLARDLARSGYRVERQKPISFEFEGMVFTEGFRADLLVESAIVVEVKSVALLAPVHAAGADLPPPAGLSCRAAHQLRRGAFEGRDQENRERRPQRRIVLFNSPPQRAQNLSPL